MRLKDKTAIVTGGGSGFGEGIARAFAAQGARVLVADISLEAAHRVASDIDGVAMRTDVSEKAAVADMAKVPSHRLAHRVTSLPSHRPSM